MRVEWFDKIVSVIQDYKKSIDENVLKETQFTDLKKAIIDNRISFYVAIQDEIIAGMCSISTVFSTYRYEYIGVFEDFYIKPEYKEDKKYEQLLY